MGITDSLRSLPETLRGLPEALREQASYANLALDEKNLAQDEKKVAGMRSLLQQSNSTNKGITLNIFNRLQLVSGDKKQAETKAALNAWKEMNRPQVREDLYRSRWGQEVVLRHPELRKLPGMRDAEPALLFEFFTAFVEQTEREVSSDFTAIMDAKTDEQVPLPLNLRMSRLTACRTAMTLEGFRTDDSEEGRIQTALAAKWNARNRGLRESEREIKALIAQKKGEEQTLAVKAEIRRLEKQYTSLVVQRNVIQQIMEDWTSKTGMHGFKEDLGSKEKLLRNQKLLAECRAIEKELPVVQKKLEDSKIKPEKFVELTLREKDLKARWTEIAQSQGFHNYNVSQYETRPLRDKFAEVLEEVERTIKRQEESLHFTGSLEQQYERMLTEAHQDLSR